MRLSGAGDALRGSTPAGGSPESHSEEVVLSSSLSQALVKSRRKSPVGARLSLTRVRFLFWKEKRLQNLPQALVAS